MPAFGTLAQLSGRLHDAGHASGLNHNATNARSGLG
jgi:hypothetical protein